MTDEIIAANIIGHTTLSQLKMQSMIAANQAAPESLPYGEHDFDEVIHDLQIKLREFMVV